MTTSPYDNLPKYIDVEVTPPPAPVVETAKDRNAEHGLQPPNPAQERPNVAHETPKPAHQRPKAAPKPPKPATMIPLTPPPKYAGLSIKNLQGCFEYILPFEESLLVPDTMPDMQKALFAEGRADLAQPNTIPTMFSVQQGNICGHNSILHGQDGKSYWGNAFQQRIQNRTTTKYSTAITEPQRK